MLHSRLNWKVPVDDSHAGGVYALRTFATSVRITSLRDRSQQLVSGAKGQNLVVVPRQAQATKD